ncbi:MAG: hypothetical protein R6U86_07095 [Bacteroidales bacterium]
MEHLSSILWLASWPLVVWLSYKVSVFMLKVFEKNLPEDQRTRSL